MIKKQKKLVRHKCKRKTLWIETFSFLIFCFSELLTSFGWIECVGCADRSAYDLTQHTKATGIKLCAEKKLPEPVIQQVTEVVPNKAPIGKAFKKVIFLNLSHLNTFVEYNSILAVEIFIVRSYKWFFCWPRCKLFWERSLKLPFKTCPKYTKHYLAWFDRPITYYFWRIRLV